MLALRLLYIAMIFVLGSLSSLGQETMRMVTTERNKSDINKYINVSDSIKSIDPDSALKRYIVAFHNSNAVQYTDGIVYCLLQIGNYYFDHRINYRRSLYYLNQALPYVEKPDLKRVQLVPQVYNLLAGSYFYTGQYDSAISFYLKAISFINLHNIKATSLAVTIYSNLGSVFSASRQYHQGVIYIQKSIDKINEKNVINKEDSSTLLSNYKNLGALYANFIRDPDSAKFWWTKAIQIGCLTKDSANLQDIYANLSLAWSSDEHFEMTKAQRYLDSAIFWNPENASYNLWTQLALSKLYYLKGQFQKAVEASHHALALCERFGIEERKLLAYYTLAFSYASLGDIKQSRKYRKAYSRLSKRLNSEEITRAISSMEVRYRVAEKEKTLAEKDKVLAENRAKLYRQRYLLTGSIGLSLALLFLLGGFIRSHRHKRRMHREQVQNLKQQNTIEQMQVKMHAEEQERTRIARELHDGLGTLISATKISQKLLAKTLPQAGNTKPYLESHQLLNQMQDEVGVITNNLIPNYITQHGLESALQTLVTRFHFPETFDIQVRSYGPVKELHPDRTFSLYRVIEEILHNAVKHSGGTRLTIQLMYHEEQLHISIEDNGSGFNVEHQHTGMGLQNIRSRVQNLNGHLHLSAKKGKGTSYMLEIPY